MASIIVNVWPTKSTPFKIYPYPFFEMLSIERALELLKAVKSTQQPINIPLPEKAILQFPRYYHLHYNSVYFAITGVRRNLQPTRWYIVFDVDKVLRHGYWHPIIIDYLIDVLSR
jgi:hypothetical protein